MRSLMWIPTTAMAGGTRSLAWQETRIFARQWRRRAERERRCSPGNAARSFTSMKSCVYPLSGVRSYRPQISHAREAHIARLMASDDIHGHGDEYRRSSAVLNLASRIAWPTWPIRLLLGCASKYRSRNSGMTVSCRTKLRSADHSTNGFARCFNCGQYSTISGTRPGFVLLSRSLQWKTSAIVRSTRVPGRRDFAALQNPGYNRVSRRFWDRNDGYRHRQVV